jgi:tetratricopeptide (TPR) repeat protein
MISLLAAALLAFTSQKLEVTANVKPGESVSGIRHFRVTVLSDDPITQVEFYVGSDLRDSDSSIPYEFDLDTVEEKDGDLPITFAAYTTKGDSAKSAIVVRVDNGVALGAQVHVSKGIDYLHDSKWDEAIVQGRIALKASPTDNQARMVMARAYLGKGELDKAQKYAEDWQQSDPNSPDANAMVTDVDLHRAFDTFSRGSDRSVALKAIQDAFKAAIDTRQRVLESAMDRIGRPTSDNLLQYADAAIISGRYSMAITALQPEFRKHVDNPQITNRLAYAQLNAGKLEDALGTLTQVEKLAKLDAYGSAMMGLLQGIANNKASSDKYIGQAVEADSHDLGVRTAQAFLALRNHKTEDLSSITQDLSQDAGDKPEVNYYLSALADEVGSFDQGRTYFQTAVFAEPLSEEAYLEEGNNSLNFAVMATGSDEDKKFRADSALAMYQTALECRPESYRSLEGMALTSLLMGNKEDALKFGLAAVNSAPTQPSTHFTYSAALQASGKTNDAFTQDRLAWKYDQSILKGRLIPGFAEAFQYFYKFDRMPVMTPPR